MDGLSVYERIENYVNDGSYEAAEQIRLSKMVNGALKTQKTTREIVNNNTSTRWLYLIIGVLIIAGTFILIRSTKK